MQAPTQANPVRRSSNKTQLEVLFSRGSIDGRMLSAGSRLYRDWFRSGSQPQMVSGCWTSAGVGKGETTQDQAMAFKGFQDAVQAVGQILSPVVIDVCLWDRSAGDYAENAGKIRADGPALLRLGLELLADHYSRVKSVAA